MTTSTDTVRRVARPRGTVEPGRAWRIRRASLLLDWAEKLYRKEVVDALDEGASFAEVSKTTGLSTSTLQRWKREVGK